MDESPAFRRVATGRGWRWIADAYGLFRRNPLIWIALNLVLLLIALALGQIPVLGSYLIYLLTPAFLAGLMFAARDAERGGEIEIAHLFRGFTDIASQLVTLGGVYLVGNVVVAGVAITLGGAELQEVLRAAAEGGTPVEPQVANKAVFAVLVAAALFVPLAMALWFAPALVMLDRVAAPKAMLLSMQACVANVLPFLLYGLVMSVLLFLALLPAALGLVLWVPIAMLSTYTGYRDVFAAHAQQPAPGELS
jgi:uncharacterized membrane protein